MAETSYDHIKEEGKPNKHSPSMDFQQYTTENSHLRFLFDNFSSLFPISLPLWICCGLYGFFPWGETHLHAWLPVHLKQTQRSLLGNGSCILLPFYYRISLSSFCLLHIRCIVTVVAKLVFEIEPLPVKMKTADYLHKEISEVLNINILSFV